MLVIKILLAIASVASLASAVNYHGHQAWRLQTQDHQQSQLLVSLLQEADIDVWASSADGWIDVSVSPEQMSLLSPKLRTMGVTHTVFIEDLQSHIDTLGIKGTSNDQTSKDTRIDLEQYHTYDEIQSYLLEVTNSSDLATLELSGTTDEGRELNVLKVSRGTPGLPAVWIDCGIHAREWVSPATCLWIISALTVDQTAEVEDLLDTHDFYILPVMNADGYNYSWTYDRMWRKNRHFNEMYPGCHGVDLNRNYNGSDWGGIGSSDYACSATYHGDFPLSERETSALTSKLLSLNDLIKASFSIHSYGQLWLFAYGYTGELPPDYDAMMMVAQVGVDAIFAVNGSTYTPGPHFATIYPSTGTIVDWGYEVLGLPYTYIIEARDFGDYGFLLPEELIAVTASEIWAGIQAAIRAIV